MKLLLEELSDQEMSAVATAASSEHVRCQPMQAPVGLRCRKFKLCLINLLPWQCTGAHPTYHMGKVMRPRTRSMGIRICAKNGKMIQNKIKNGSLHSKQHSFAHIKPCSKACQTWLTVD